MKTQDASLKQPLTLAAEGTLAKSIQEVSEGCINCPSCQKECAFLRKYGTPKAIAKHIIPMTRSACQWPTNAACVVSAPPSAP